MAFIPVLQDRQKDKTAIRGHEEGKHLRWKTPEFHFQRSGENLREQQEKRNVMWWFVMYCATHHFIRHRG